MKITNLRIIWKRQYALPQRYAYRRQRKDGQSPQSMHAQFRKLCVPAEMMLYFPYYDLETRMAKPSLHKAWKFKVLTWGRKFQTHASVHDATHTLTRKTLLLDRTTQVMDANSLDMTFINSRRKSEEIKSIIQWWLLGRRTTRQDHTIEEVITSSSSRLVFHYCNEWRHAWMAHLKAYHFIRLETIRNMSEHTLIDSRC